ncbi:MULTISPECIES: hypothetical protein [Weeksellaceae]|jgi:hypothetical protein|uniref:hypothetical protein n=1 Tax=Weeksellaceae TaxID=2762318 RepID=UPI001F0ABF34|nr:MULTISPECIES: hypothetical protein [Weeksellaceae]UMQ41748.1 hypothetical protein MKS83_20470 [Chryseobacterium sp. Y16C]WQM38118.1 hypothetical protein U2S95_17335 [Elizabethkingia miricola]
MKKIILFFIGKIIVHVRDLKVFDLKLGEPMNIRECAFQIAESSSKNGILAT